MTLDERVSQLEKTIAGIANGIVSKNFILLDADGRPCAVLGVNGGGPDFSFHDKNGKCRIRLQVDGEGLPMISLHDSTGSNRVFLCVTPMGDPALSMFDENDTQKVVLVVNGGKSVLLMDDVDEGKSD